MQPVTVTEASECILSGAIAPIDLVEACLDRIAAVDGRIHSYIHVDAEGARAAAHVAKAELAAFKTQYPSDKNVPYALYFMGVAEHELGNYWDALLYFSEFADAHWQHDWIAYVYYWAGSAYVGLGECGYVNANGDPNPAYSEAETRIAELARLGAAVIAEYRARAECQQGR